MGFLGKTVFAKRLNKSNLFVLAALVSTILCTVVSVDAYAEVQSAEGIFTDANDVRWEYVHVVDTETSKEAVAIKYFDKPASMTTIVIPSLSDVIANVPNASQNLDTYYLDDANEEYQAAHFTETKRESTAQINKLDMSNTAKIQISGIKPMIDPEVETELVFGEQMVISDILSNVSYTIGMCNGNDFSPIPRWIDTYRCDNEIRKVYTVNEIKTYMPSWYLLTSEERQTRRFTLDELNAGLGLGLSSTALERKFYEGGLAHYYLPEGVAPESNMWYYYSFEASGIPDIQWRFSQEGVFSGYKLKLTNLGNFNYVGWGAFSNTTLDEDSRVVTLMGGYDGDSIFANSNVKKVILTNNHYGDRTFANCSDITEIDFGDAEMISTEMFMGTNLGSLDLSNTSVKTIRPRGFKNANISDLNIDGVQRLEHQAFMGNGGLTEIYLPKSINWLGGAIFEECDNILKATIAYDTLTSGTASTFHAAFQYASDSYYSQSKLEELVILAPYAEDEEVSPTHVTYDDYKWHWYYTNEWVDNNFDRTSGNAYGWTHNTGYEREYASEDQFAHVDTYKNVIAPVYFSQLKSLKKITIGEGYEYIGAMAFWDTGYNPGKASYLSESDWLSFEQNNGYASGQKMFERLTLPSTLKGVGNLAFNSIGGKDIGLVIPEGIEYIGIAAFRGVMALEIENFDFPNLKFLGDEAFMATRVKNVVLHDSLEYFGRLVFANCPYINDVTIDFDIYNPEKNAYYNPARPYYHESNVASPYQNEVFRVHFGLSVDGFSESGMDALGIAHGVRENNNAVVKKYGTIKYTSKVVTDYPWTAHATSGSSNSGPYFANMVVDKIDLSECGWTTIRPFFFSAATIGEVLLPNGLLSIDESAFNTTTIEKELILPDSVYGISKEAFNQIAVLNRGHETIKITKLPSSLQYVQQYTFYGDSNLTAAVDTDLKTVYDGGFSKTGVTDITLKDSLIYIDQTAFVDIPTLKNITIDFDLAGSNIYNSHYNFVNLFNQSDRPFDSVELNVESIVFTSKNVTSPVTGDIAVYPYCEYGYYVDSRNRHYCSNEWHTGYYGTQLSSTLVPSSFFYNINAAKIDLSEAQWDNMPLNMFLNVKTDELSLPGGVENIPKDAFYGAEIGGKLIIPSSVKTMDESAFNQAKIDELDLGSSVLTAIPYGAFYGAEIGGELKIPDTVTSIDIAFVDSKLGTVILPTSLASGGGNAEFFNAEVEKVIVPDGTKVIPDKMFLGIRAAGFEVADSLEYIGEAAFYLSDVLEMDVDFPNLKHIGKVAFMKTSVRDVVLHDKLEFIGDGAFLYVPTLRNITIDCDLFGLGSFYSFYSVFSTTPRDQTYQDQERDNSTFGDVVFTEKSIAPPNRIAAFVYLNFNSFDFSNAKWESIPYATFYRTTVNEPLALPSSIKTIDGSGFQEGNFKITNELPEGLQSVGYGAFYATNCFDDLVIPSTVTSIGWSAFSAGPADVYYNSVTIKPKDLTLSMTSNQPVFVILWNAKIDKLIVESETLPVMNTLGTDGNGKYTINSGSFVKIDPEDTSENPALKQLPEFHDMVVNEVVLNNLKLITSNAFEECAYLTTVDLSQNSNLQYIGRNAFLNASKLSKVNFGTGLIGKDVSVGEYAFKNTGIETIGVDDNAGFNLAAANFNTTFLGSTASTTELVTVTDSHAFAEMPVLRSVNVPSNFANKNIPTYTFANDAELSEASLDWQIESLGEGAFNNDNKLKKLFIWGNADVHEATDLTIPEVTTIFAYSDAPAEQYANADSRDNYEGKFYALDEVLYLATNKTYVILNDDKDDFDKEGLILYALRRDGVILESDDWQTYTTAYPRSTVNISFDQGRGMIGSDTADIAAIVYDAPKPFEYVSLANQNYANVDFNLLQMPSSNNPLVLINYPDGYTGNVRTATLASMTKEEEEEYLREPELEVPDTGVFLNVVKTATPVVSVAAIVVAGVLFVVRKRRE